MPKTLTRHLAPLCALLALTACGTTYQLAEIDAGTAAQAAAMFGATDRDTTRRPNADPVAKARFDRVVARVRPVAEAFCRRELADTDGTACNVSVGIDTRMAEPNAYFTYDDPVRGRDPAIKFTVPILRDFANDDELAFVLGHEYGHLIGQHIQKQQQQAVAGALILGIAAAAATQGAYNSQQIVEDSANLGGMVGQRAFSQSYELESDTLGTLIARQAGYDPVRGAAYFARPSQPQQVGDRLSFWGTHPPDAKRLATVMATVRQIEAQGGIGRKAARTQDAAPR